MDNRFELVYNDRDDAAELKNLPIGKFSLHSLLFQTITCTASLRKKKWRTKVVMKKLKSMSLQTDEILETRTGRRLSLLTSEQEDIRMKNKRTKADSNHFIF
jgi:hypothetical protein